jgi:hypothetical protein
MYQTVNFQNFCGAFSSHDKDVNFSYEAKRALFDYLEEEEVELDVISLCCSFTEYQNLAEVQKEYPRIKDLENLREATLVLPLENGGLVIAQF